MHPIEIESFPMVWKSLWCTPLFHRELSNCMKILLIHTPTSSRAFQWYENPFDAHPYFIESFPMVWKSLWCTPLFHWELSDGMKIPLMHTFTPSRAFQWYVKSGQDKQGIANTLTLPIDKDVVHLPTYYVHTLNTKNKIRSNRNSLNTSAKETGSPNVKRDFN
jgi:hypothetical protein